MIRPRLVPLLLATALAGCDCGTQGFTSTPGILSVQPAAIQFGTGCVEDSMVRELVLENIGNAELTFEDVRLSGRDYTLLDGPPDVLAPGEAVVVRVALTPSSAGDFAGTLTFTTDEEEEPNRSVTLFGKGFAGEKYALEVTCESIEGSGEFDRSCYFLSFDDVLTGTTKERTFQIANNGCGLVTVNELYFYADEFDESEGADVELFQFVYGEGETEAPFDLRGESKRLVTVRYSPVEAGQPQVRLKLRSTDPNVKDQQWGPGEWDIGLFANSVAPALLVDPPIITFFEALAGTPLEKTVLVANTGSAPLTIDTLEIKGEDGTQDFTLNPADAPPFTLPPTGQPGSDRQVRVVYTSSGPGSDRAKLVVGAGQDQREVTLLGGTEPLLVVRWLDPVSGDEREGRVDFGTLQTGEKGVQRTVRLKNEGQAPLAISKVELPEADNPAGAYSLGSFTPGEVAPGAHMDLVITLDDAVGLRDDFARLRIVSNDPVDASAGGARTVDLVSKNEPNFRPVPIIEVCSKLREDAECSSAVSPGRILELDGSKSTGPEPGDTLTFEWRIVTKPTGSTAKIQDPNQMLTRMVSDDGQGPDVLGAYGILLIVKDQFDNVNELRQVVNAR